MQQETEERYDQLPSAWVASAHRLQLCVRAPGMGTRRWGDEMVGANGGLQGRTLFSEQMPRTSLMRKGPIDQFGSYHAPKHLIKNESRHRILIKIFT